MIPGALSRVALLLVCTTTASGAVVDKGTNSPTALSEERPIAIHELGYLARLWNVEQGLPEDNVTSLAQTSDGYLWTGSWNGLGRFDGLRFQRNDPWSVSVMQENPQLKVLADGANRLWVRSARGHLVFRENGRFQSAPFKLESPFIDGSMALNEAGDFFLCSSSDSRIQRWNGKQLDIITEHDPQRSIRSIVVDHEQRIWGTWQQSLNMFLVEGKSFKPVLPALDAPNSDTGMFYLRRGGNASLITPGGIWDHQAGVWNLRRQLSRSPGNIFLGVCEDGLGGVWFATQTEGLCVSLPDGRTVRVRLPETGTILNIQAMMTDTEGNVWVGTEPAGLYRIRRAIFRSWLEADGLSDRRVTAVCGDVTNGVWFTCRRNIHRLLSDAATPRLIPGLDVLPSSLTASRDGGIWAGDNRGGVYRLTDNEPPRLIGKLPGDRRVYATHESGDGTLRAANSTGLFRWSENRFVAEDISAALQPGLIASISEDEQGRLYAITDGLLRRDENGWKRLSHPEDAGSSRLGAFCIEKDGTVWGTAQHPGLIRWKNDRWFAYEGKHNEVPSFAVGVALDDVGGLWLATDHGVGRYEVAALNRWADGGEETRGIWFDREDGLGSIDCSVLPNGVRKSSDGRLWFGTANGLSVVDPAEFRENGGEDRPPPVHIEEVFIDDQPAAITPKVTLRPGWRRVDFRFTALNLSAPEKCLFAYRLIGFDPDWVNVGTRRAAYYQKLPPGEYHFQVAAANKHQAWNYEGASLALIVEPAWWQTSLSRGAFAATSVGLLASAYAWRWRRLKREQSAREEFTRKLIASQEEERKRIAGELHDGLGQNLLILKNRLYLAQEQSVSDLGKSQFADLNEAVTQAIAEVREISLNLRPHQLERLGLTKALQANVRKVSTASRLDIKADIGSVDGLFASADEINFYRIVQEGLNNVVKHADASSVSLSVHGHDGTVVVRLEDDGRGFDYVGLINDPTRPRGLGLSGLAERTRIMGGKFRCDTAPGAGTRLTIELPINK